MPKKRQKHIVLSREMLTQLRSEMREFAKQIKATTPAAIENVLKFAKMHAPGEDASLLVAAIRNYRHNFAQWYSKEATNAVASTMESAIITEARKYGQTPDEWLDAPVHLSEGQSIEQAQADFLMGLLGKAFQELLVCAFKRYSEGFARTIVPQPGKPHAPSARILAKAAEIHGEGNGVHWLLFGEDESLKMPKSIEEVWKKICKNKSPRVLH